MSSCKGGNSAGIIPANRMNLRTSGQTELDLFLNSEIPTLKPCPISCYMVVTHVRGVVTMLNLKKKGVLNNPA